MRTQAALLALVVVPLAVVVSWVALQSDTAADPAAQVDGAQTDDPDLELLKKRGLKIDKESLIAYLRSGSGVSLALEADYPDDNDPFLRSLSEFRVEDLDGGGDQDINDIVFIMEVLAT
jgi:hypothetical protein